MPSGAPQVPGLAAQRVGTARTPSQVMIARRSDSDHALVRIRVDSGRDRTNLAAKFGTTSRAQGMESPS